MSKQISKEQKQKYVDAVNQARSKGLSLQKAVSKVGGRIHTYYNWAKDVNEGKELKAENPVAVISLPAAKSPSSTRGKRVSSSFIQKTPTILVMGSAEEIYTFYKKALNHE